MILPATARTRLRKRMMGIIATRRADVVIGENDNPYLLRWYLIPRNRWLNVYLHSICRSDDDRAAHSHPWLSVSVLLDGHLAEWYRTPRGDAFRSFRPGQIVFRSAKFSHRLVVPDCADALTLFITGPKIREWGFWCGSRFVHWRDFTAADDSSKVGRGCDQ
jgi:hypothetical protein